MRNIRILSQWLQPCQMNIDKAKYNKSLVKIVNDLEKDEVKIILIL